MDTKCLAPNTVLKGKYRVMRLVGGGGMAWVYEVEEVRADGSRRNWAMKELRTDNEDTNALREERQLFEQEANILVRLDHPNLPQVCAFFEEQGRSYLVMEFIHGESLEKRLEHANAPILESQVLDWAIQICNVLTYLHTRPQPIIFRDMKPSNVMVRLDGRIKLIDFGIARTYKVGQRKDTVTMGSENYAAPEQWGKAQTDPRADIYALGATMYHLLTNVPPLPAFVPTPRVPMQQYNPAVSERTAALVDKAMSETRDQRFPSAAAMREALLECLSKRDRQIVEARQRQLLEQAQTTAAPQSTPVATPQVVTPQVVVAQQVVRPRPTVIASQPLTVTPQTAPPTLVSPVPAAQATASAQPVTASAKPNPPGLGTQPFTKPCPRCSTLNRPEGRFCRHCGYTFVPPLPPVLAVLSAPGVRSAGRPRWEFPLRSASALIGRKGGRLPVDLDLEFYDPEGYVSRNHARVTVDQRRYYYATDLASGNGTYVNEEQLTPNTPRLLRNGDQIRVGKVVLQFRIR